LADEVQANVATLKGRLERYGLGECLALCSWDGEALSEEVTNGCLDLEAAVEADLLLNLRYTLPGEVVERFRRSAMLDIDPGLLQLLMSQGVISVPQHDLYFTIGETVGQPGARFPDMGLKWHYTPPPVFLPEWPLVKADTMAPYTTVSHWWAKEWVEFKGELRDNNKRPAFLAYSDLPSRTSAPLELALCLAPGDEGETRRLEERGWNIRHSWTVSAGPEEYRAYIQQSRGEFSVVKPSCVWLEGSLWTPLLLALPLLALIVGMSLAQATLSAARASFTGSPRSRISRLKLHSLIALLHLLQPLARLWGRLHGGLTPWRRSSPGFSLPWPRTSTIWSEGWNAPEKTLQFIEAALRAYGVAFRRGGNYDRWDLEVRRGMHGAVRLLMANQVHEAGNKQLLIFRTWPFCSPNLLVLTYLFAVLTIVAALDDAWAAAMVLGGVALLLIIHLLQQCGGATAATLGTLQKLRGEYTTRDSREVRSDLDSP
jgi:hypothetical protein